MKSQEKLLKMAAISGASNAIKYKDKNPNATESEVLKHINSKLKEILSKLD